MSAPTPALEFWFEPASTYSYLSAVRIGDLARQAGVVVRYRPFLLGPIFASQGWDNSPFNIYPAKGRYMWRDIERTAERLGLPWKRPSVFPRNGLLAARAALVAAERGFAQEFVPALYRAAFERDAEIADPGVVEALLESLGRNAKEVMGSALSDENKQKLRHQTERAAELGIFGSPTFVTGSELFWGNDRLEEAIDWAASHDGPRDPQAGGGSCGFPNDF
jgi:2-hydroxychromene-2-carboxylate isomerase